MLRISILGFVLAHGLLHVAIAAPPPARDAPFDAGRSWVLAAGGASAQSMRGVGVGLATAAAAAFAVAALGMLGDTGWWPSATVAAAALSLAHLTLYFHPWLTLGVVIDLAMLWGVQTGWLADRLAG